MADLFVSYAREDESFVKELEAQLVSCGLTLWKDTTRLEAGDQWRASIDAALDSSDIVLVVVSPAAMESTYVTYEWARALGASKAVVPILLKDAKIHSRLGDLHHEDFREARPWGKLVRRIDALRAEQKKAPPVVSGAMAGLDHEDPERQLEAVTLLGRLDHPKAKEALVGALRHPNGDVGRLAALVLGKSDGSQEVDALLAVVADEGSPYRRHALWALSERPRPENVYRVLRGFLEAEDDVKRAAAVRALGHERNAADLPRAIEALADASPCVRYYALGALESFGKEALPELLAATTRPAAAEGRHALVTALGRIGDDRAIPFLVSQLADPGTQPISLTSIWLDHRDGVAKGGGGRPISSAAASALERIGSTAARDALEAWNKAREKGKDPKPS